MKGGKKSVGVSLLAIPEVMASTLIGLYDVLNSFTLLSTYNDAVPSEPPFTVEIVGSSRGLTHTSSGMPILAGRSIDDIDSTDVIIVPSVIVARGEWLKGKHPSIVRWLTEMHAKGAQLCRRAPAYCCWRKPVYWRAKKQPFTGFTRQLSKETFPVFVCA